MKIALVKQDLYQDLYVCKNKEEPFKMLESTLMRIGPLALFTDYNADFFIVKENKARECRYYKFSLRISKKLKHELQNMPAEKISADYFSYLKPLSKHSHKDFAVEAETINWSNYDIVISINICVPKKITEQYPKTLWCYMFGEASYSKPYPIKGYDVILTQNLTGEVADSLGRVDFPYTFLTHNTLENIAKKAFPNIQEEKKGVYAEINCTSKRPVESVPQLEFVEKLGHPLYFHNQNIIENLKLVHKAKYFIKLGGRKIRGNSVIEAISAGTLVLMNPKDVTHSQLLPKETWVYSQLDIETIIKKLDANKNLYLQLLDKQRELLQFFVIDTPMESLKNCLEQKLGGKKNIYPNLIKEFIKKLKRFLRELFM